MRGRNAARETKNCAKPSTHTFVDAGCRGQTGARTDRHTRPATVQQHMRQVSRVSLSLPAARLLYVTLTIHAPSPRTRTLLFSPPHPSPSRANAPSTCYLFNPSPPHLLTSPSHPLTPSHPDIYTR
mmetsp:Transcript_81097/g.161241  ORF Transcript_81097/g.161241 Transcript_81097/m.161241 type:complete len:126 (+) Transcript_81097:148-525(+)